MTLKYTFEGVEYETPNQYINGQELKDLFGVPHTTELFLAIKRPYEDELIENTTKVNLARPGIEQFYVKKKLDYSVNGISFISYKQFISGEEIKLKAGLSLESILFIDVDDEWEDSVIENDELVDLARPGKEKFYTKDQFEIIVNGELKFWNKNQITFDEVLELAGLDTAGNPNTAYTISYDNGHHSKPEGVLVKGKKVKVVNKIRFYASATYQS
ncbi:multiubiquitin domain-containing protein [Faecalibacter bovis]|uniref:Multiubiquitin domain-containing protein n=1 Tax=Faecalibacter bovis TaxID=2898187 RepID=A0ABX7XFX9_9FLAO|nr:multiubiquitin domain-containing protein [Faecalibacter bovis]QTV06744.1 multiubiquitin domain-containing protein [Faecalibacter bovis]